MKLTRVTISGADDKVPHEALIDLSAEFEFVEWGLLLSRTRQGSPRYPSADWMLRFKAPDVVSISYHLCGALARETMSGKVPVRLTPERPKVRSFGHKAQRVQLNGFSDYVLPGLYAADLLSDMEFILQCSTHDALARAQKLAESHSNVTALWDQSGGTGARTELSPLPFGQLRVGYAGGIDEHNITRVLTRLAGGEHPSDSWIDLETGARTEDNFDLAKVRRILELAKGFVGVADGGA